MIDLENGTYECLGSFHFIIMSQQKLLAYVLQNIFICCVQTFGVVDAVIENCRL
jgi:cobalamin biosynthesis Co2+ chelatase CbiK